MREPANVSEVAQLQPDYLGFIFYPGSSRFVGETLNIPALPAEIKKTGVFVKAELRYILDKIEQYRLAAVQLHGDESPAFCAALRDANPDISIIKAFRVNEAFDFAQTVAFAKSCTFFLFDTKAKQYGGTGKKFNWDLLANYSGQTPFFLSGGIGPGDAPQLQAFSHPKWVGIDLNSGFEISPANKNIEALERFIG